MVLTKKNYLFVSMHGAQEGKLGLDEGAFNEYMINNNQKFLNDTVTEFLTANNVTKVEGAYVMGDFNDRYDAIKDFNFGNEIKPTYKGDAPKACCFNWDSMANKDHHNKGKEGNPQGKKPEPKEIKEFIATNTLQTKLDEHGNKIENYLNKGDKVFAYPNAGMLKIYASKHNLKNDVSQASDHELVFMTIPPLLKRQERFEISRDKISPVKDDDDNDDNEDAPAPDAPPPTEGGKRKTRRRRSTKKSKKTKKNTSKKSRKSKKTKKGRK